VGDAVGGHGHLVVLGLVQDEDGVLGAEEHHLGRDARVAHDAEATSRSIVIKVNVRRAAAAHRLAVLAAARVVWAVVGGGRRRRRQ
jgi:hypothetical protein